MTQTSTATQITARITKAVTDLDALIAAGAGIETRERAERRVNNLKAQHRA